MYCMLISNDYIDGCKHDFVRVVGTPGNIPIFVGVLNIFNNIRFKNFQYLLCMLKYIEYLHIIYVGSVSVTASVSRYNDT